MRQFIDRINVDPTPNALNLLVYVAKQECFQ